MRCEFTRGEIEHAVTLQYYPRGKLGIAREWPRGYCFIICDSPINLKPAFSQLAYPILFTAIFTKTRQSTISASS